MHIRELVTEAAKHGVEGIELKAEYEDLLRLEGLRGDGEVEALAAMSARSGVSICGFFLVTDGNMTRDIMMAKKCIGLLHKLGGRLLRIEFSQGHDIGAFLKSLARFASYRAGGNGETTVRIAFDPFSHSKWDFQITTPQKPWHVSAHGQLFFQWNLQIGGIQCQRS